jgi:hypothetical protein
MNLEGLPTEGGEDSIRQELARLLGVEIHQIALSQDTTPSRRQGAQTIVLEIVGDPAKPEQGALVDKLDSGALVIDLAAKLLENHNLSVIIEISRYDDAAANSNKGPEGEVWKEFNGAYILQHCPRGYLLVNMTVRNSYFGKILS